MCFKFLHRYENLHTGFVLYRTDVQCTHGGDSVFIAIIIIICTTNITAPARCNKTQRVDTAAVERGMVLATGYKQLGSSKRRRRCRQHPSAGPASHPCHSRRAAATRRTRRSKVVDPCGTITADIDMKKRTKIADN